MQKIKTKILLIAATCFATGLAAQNVGKIEGGLNLDNFPKVEFIYHSNNPETLQRDDIWELREGNTVHEDFGFKHLTTEQKEQALYSVILWEDMGCNNTTSNGRSSQHVFTQTALSNFFSGRELPANHKFAIATFNRQGNTASFLNHLTSDFDASSSSLQYAVNNHKPSRELYAELPNQSDLYTAIREGMDMLAPKNGAKCIIVFTAGRSVKSSGADSDAQVLIKAQQLHIPVYIFQYYQNSGVANDTKSFATSTYGAFTPCGNANDATNALSELYSNVIRRYNGHDYKISFTSNALQGDDARTITLTVNGYEVSEQLLPPASPQGFAAWVKSHLILTIIIGVITLLIIIAIIYLVIRNKRNARKFNDDLNNMKQRQIDDMRAAEQNQFEMLNRLKEEHEQQIKAQELERQRIVQQAAEQAEYERICEIMATRRLYPRLTYQLDDEHISTYNVTQPITTIGRENCDMLLDVSNVSRLHARLIFDGNNFEIIDNNSTNKVIVNDTVVTRAILRNGDKICLGQVIIVFNL